MRIEADKQQRLVTIWLPKDEAGTQLNAIVDQYRGMRYRVAVFRSGEQDLFECTTGLLLNNRG